MVKMKILSVTTLVFILCPRSDGFLFGAHTTPCMDDWVAYNGSCYLFGHGNPMSFFESQHYCEHFEATLVHIDDVHENNFLMDYVSRLKVYHFWLGLTDEMVEGEWRWVDSDTRPTFTDWRPGQPNVNTSEDCGAVENTYEWGDFPCDGLYFPLCEINLGLNGAEVVG